MADVTGSIGNEYVEFNNAATEATLKQLLAAVQRQGGTSAAGATASAASAAGVNAASVAAAKASAKSLQELAEKGEKLKQTYVALATGMADLTGKLLQGTSNSSDLFSAFERLPGVAGMVASGFAKVARFQEENLGAYQKITDAGVSFGGSLTDMRTAAASTYMTLDEFTGLMKRNSESFARMGGTADQGARAFTSLSNSLMKSEIGDDLRALGFSSAQVNEGLAGFLANTGARTRQEMQNTGALTKGAAEYLTQLDGLAQITGKSREELEKEQKARNQNAAYQAALMGMTEDQRKAMEQGATEMKAKFGKAGEEMYMAQMLGLPPMTEASQKLTALAPEVAKASQAMVDNAKAGGSLESQQKLSAKATEGAAQAANRLGGVAGALSFSSDSTGQALMGLTKEANRAKAQGTESAAAGEKQLQEIAAEQKKRQESQAKDAVEAQKAMQELGQTILSALLPVIKILTPAINVFAQVVTIIAKQFEKLNGIVQIIIATGLALLAFQKLKVARQAAGQIPGGGGSGSAKGAMGAASKFAKLGGAAGALIGGASLYSSFGDINDEVKSGKMTEADASKAKTTAVGETGGGVAGGIAGAAAGAAIGSIVPIIGTAIGALIGGALGSYGGSSLGKSAADALTGQKKAADGLMVNTPTSILAGEAGPEVVAPTKHFENLQNELQTLNKQTAEVIMYLKETAEYSRRSNDSIKNLGGDLFKF